MKKVKVYECLNCGFVFKTPKYEWRKRPLNPGEVWSIQRSALYYKIDVCPKCGSDAIIEKEVKG